MTVLYSFELSLLVELLQLVFKVGSFDVDDLFLNTIGGLLGYLVYRQRGNSFPSCAWRISQLPRDFSLAFALDFLDLTTFLRQIFGKIYSSDFLTTLLQQYHIF